MSRGRLDIDLKRPAEMILKPQEDVSSTMSPPDSPDRNVVAVGLDDGVAPSFPMWVPCDVYFQHGVKVAGSPFIRLDADRHGAQYNEAMGLIRFTHVADRASMSIHHPSGPVVKERKAGIG